MVALEQLIIPIFSFILFIIILHKLCSGTIFPTRKNLPPSPRKLPIIGNLHQLGTSPHRSLQSLSKRYGNLILLHFGRVPVLVASSADAALEIMKNQDLIFSNRPKLSIPDRLIYGSRDVGFAPYGEYWRQTRSVCVLQLLSTKRVQSFRRVREEETSAMVVKIRQLGSSSQIVNLSDVLMSLTNDVVCRAALGRKYGDHGEDKKFKRFLREFVELLGTTSLRDYIPWLGWIDRVSGLDAKVERVAKQFDEFLENVIQEHRDGKLTHDDGDGECDFVGILLEFQRDNKSRSPVEDETIKAVILVIILFHHCCDY
ncbi:cytochrome p450 71a6 [Phtheirospermum japonicum]|uniref:Cytochrome p450 71a6 n=1 Tax=Phtheirospermum japonicum TaxID=374723 RepID=A0A830D7X4_9LAMI|nr:cytochrome p450 71a6 [Phtheirospermum japonicum]